MFMFQVQLPPVRWSRKVHKGSVGQLGRQLRTFVVYS